MRVIRQNGMINRNAVQQHLHRSRLREGIGLRRPLPERRCFTEKRQARTVAQLSGGDGKLPFEEAATTPMRGPGIFGLIPGGETVIPLCGAPGMSIQAKNSSLAHLLAGRTAGIDKKLNI